MTQPEVPLMQHALIVEDKVDTLVWLEAALRDVFPDIACHRAQNVAQALAVLERQEPDLALIDLGLPDDSGLKVLAALRPRRTTGIVVSIFDDDFHLFPALRAGARGYLLKDMPRPQFLRHLRGIVDGEPPLSPAIARRLLSWFDPAPTESDCALTEREREVLVLVAKGLKLAQVADMLGITRHTCAGHVKSIYRKLNISSRAEAVMEASRLGLIEL